LTDSEFALGKKTTAFTSEERSLYTMPSNLDLDSLNANRDMVDKPTQWVAGMMELPLDPQSKIRNVE